MVSPVLIYLKDTVISPKHMTVAWNTQYEGQIHQTRVGFHRLPIFQGKGFCVLHRWQQCKLFKSVWITEQIIKSRYPMRHLCVGNSCDGIIDKETGKSALMRGLLASEVCWQLCCLFVHLWNKPLVICISLTLLLPTICMSGAQPQHILQWGCMVSSDSQSEGN